MGMGNEKDEMEMEMGYTGMNKWRRMKQNSKRMKGVKFSIQSDKGNSSIHIFLGSEMWSGFMSVRFKLLHHH